MANVQYVAVVNNHKRSCGQTWASNERRKFAFLAGIDIIKYDDRHLKLFENLN